MLLSVLRNRTGLKLQDQFRAQGKDFDWDEFKAQFNADYGECRSKQLMQLLNEKFGFHTLKKSAQPISNSPKFAAVVRRSKRWRTTT